MMNQQGSSPPKQIHSGSNLQNNASTLTAIPSKKAIGHGQNVNRLLMKEKNQMENRKRFLVQLPGHADPFILPITLSAALSAISCAGNAGINTAELEYEGFSNVSKLISRLRKRGVPIQTTRWSVEDEEGNVHNRIAYYSVIRGPLSAPKHWDPKVQISVTRLSDFGSATSRIKEIRK